MLPYVDLVIGSEEDAADVLNIHAGRLHIEQGFLDIESYPNVAKMIIQQFPNVNKVAINLRESISASYNKYSFSNNEI